MPITILERLGTTARGVLARVAHGGSEFETVVVGDVEAAIAAQQPVVFEMDYDEIVSCRVVPGYDDADSGLWGRGSDRVILRGRAQAIHGSDGDLGIDLYVMNGAEFFFFPAAEAGIDVLKRGVGLELEIKGLQILLRS